MTVTTIRAQVTEDGPLNGAEVLIRWDEPDITQRIGVDVHLDAIGRHAARWVPIQLVQQYLDATPDTGDAA